MDVIASAFNIGNAQSWKCTVTSCAGTGSITGLRQAATIGLARQQPGNFLEKADCLIAPYPWNQESRIGLQSFVLIPLKTVLPTWIWELFTFCKSPTLQVSRSINLDDWIHHVLDDKLQSQESSNEFFNPLIRAGFVIKSIGCVSPPYTSPERGGWWPELRINS